MVRIKRGMLIASMFMLVSIVLSACNQPYSQAPAVTNTPIQPNNLFASAQPTTMDNVSSFATGSAVAQLTTSPGAPAAATATLMPGVTPPAATNTPAVIVNPTSTATLAVPNNAPSATALQAGSNPGSYTLQDGEFVYCIARRFNVDPDEVLALNGLADSQTIYAGLALKLPQTGRPFPGNRMLRTHPATYTVATTGETVYSVACTFGDADPARIAQNNNISVGTVLTAGQTLNIP